jgi:hypothetical protein
VCEAGVSITAAVVRWVSSVCVAQCANNMQERGPSHAQNEPPVLTSMRMQPQTEETVCALVNWTPFEFHA